MKVRRQVRGVDVARARRQVEGVDVARARRCVLDRRSHSVIRDGRRWERRTFFV